MTLDDPSPLEGAPRSAEPWVPALEALAGLPLAPAPRLDRARLDPVVAATLRAALDLMIGESPARRPIVVAHDDGAIELTLADYRPESLSAAGAFLETVEGNLGAAAQGDAVSVRVPAAGPRPFYLMLEQGTLAIAVPWHAVIRVRLVRPEALDALARREGCGLLAPFVSVPHQGSERPAVLVGFGIRRAFLPADRLVWRMPADPFEVADAPPDPELGRAVRTSEGDVYWAVDPGHLLRLVEPPVFSAPRPAPVRPPAHRPTLPTATRPSATRPDRPRLVELRREDVEPIPAAPAAETAPAAPPAQAPVVHPPVAQTAAARRVLVAEDSIVGRIFLQRLLENLGFVVEVVGRARDLQAALRGGPWEAAFVDVELPDSPRGEHLAWARVAADEGRLRLVALVRDRDDARAAAAAGVPHALRKPFESADLDRLIREIGLERSRG